MIELYHFAFSTCSQKVRLVLAEKGLDFASREVNLIAGGQHDPEYVKLNPKHVVPTLVHDGHVLVESSLIVQYLDDAFPEPAMRPADALGRHAVGRWLLRADTEIHVAAPTVTFALGPRAVLLQQPAEVREANLAAIPDPVDRAKRRSVIEHGVRAPEFAGALRVFVAMLDDMEAALASAPWLSGSSFGLADATIVPYVLRLEHLAMDPLLDAAARPRVADWLARAKSRASFAAAVDAWAPQALVDGMRAQGKEAWPEVEAALRGAA
ncbi:MAG: glutathione S-transferase family protein [Myxococcota bacterium]